MKVRKLLASIALGSLLAAPVVAQVDPSAEPVADPANDSETIVVTGTTMTRGEAFKLAENYTRAVFAPSVSDQNARWEVPICLSVVGLREEAAVQIIDRVEAIAKDVGAPVAGPGCSPNVFLAFSKDADADFENVSTRRAGILKDTSAEELRKLRTPGLPVRWFYAQRAQGVGGRGTFKGENGVPILRNIKPSRIDSPIEVSITGCTVLVDMPRASQVSVGALTDYIAFAVLSRTQVSARPGPDSIMDLFEKGEGERPDAMTVFDKALLKALYRLPTNRNAAIHRAQLASEIVKELATAN